MFKTFFFFTRNVFYLLKNLLKIIEESALVNLQTTSVAGVVFSVNLERA